MGQEFKRDRLEVDVVEALCERLSGLQDLHLPYKMRCREEPVSQSEIKALLVDLLLRDAALFLVSNRRRQGICPVRRMQRKAEGELAFEISLQVRALFRILIPNPDDDTPHWLEACWLY